MCDLIVTATTSPLLWAEDLRGGTHVTAVGADTLHKQELDPHILAEADLVVADSVSQCLERGELSHAAREGLLDADDVTELGRIAAGEAPGRTYEDQVTVADLTGLAVQDLQIATAVHEALAGGQG